MADTTVLVAVSLLSTVCYGMIAKASKSFIRTSHVQEVIIIPLTVA
jgi:hypothetical protein